MFRRRAPQHLRSGGVARREPRRAERAVIGERPDDSFRDLQPYDVTRGDISEPFDLPLPRFPRL
jgi:hypothetical protein